MRREGRSKLCLWIAAVVPLLFAAVLPSHVARVVCRFTGVTMMPVETCCPVDSVDSDEGSRDPQARFRDEGCCSITTLELPTLVSERRSEAHQPLPDELRVGALSTTVPAPAERNPLPRQIVPPSRPPPLALKRSLLI
jgi:hypothetical protein